jgi:hypothetical protein
MRLFCTCDCRKTQEASENALREVRAVKADLEDLWDRFVRLQGRLAKRGSLSTSQDAPGPTNDAPEVTGDHPTPRGNPVALELLRKVGRVPR